MKFTKIPIKGMHCRSCELLISDELMQVKGVQDVEVNYMEGCAKVYHRKPLHNTALIQAVRNAGYSVGREPLKPWFSKDPNDYIQVAGLSIILFVIFYIARDAGLFKLTEFASNNLNSLPLVLMLGLAAGFSTCAALVGGLVLGASARFAEKHPDATVQQKFMPHIFFNLGRIISFFVFGAVIGLIGSMFQMSLGVMGFLTMIIGGVMLIFGLQLTELFPRLSKINITLPSGIAKSIGLSEKTNKEYSHKNSIVLGGLTFFLPCGFTQLVQLYAISTASPITAALTMSVFAIGTTPGLLGIGGLTSIVKGSFAKTFFKFAGVLVIALALFNISNGYNLSGLKNGMSISAQTKPVAKGSGEVQVLKTTYKLKEDIQPSTFTVKAGQPVRLEVDVQQDGFGCMGSFAIPRLSKQVEMLVKGKTLVYEFTPTDTGTYDITCAMGVPRGSITVI